MFCGIKNLLHSLIFNHQNLLTAASGIFITINMVEKITKLKK